jgi:hypothetical protein
MVFIAKGNRARNMHSNNN